MDVSGYGDAFIDVEYILKNFKPEEMISDHKVCQVLKKTLGDKDTEASDVISILHNLEQCVTLLNQEHVALIMAILNMNWLDGGPEVIKVYHGFVLNLFSAHTSYFKPFLVTLIKKMREEYPVSSEESEEDKLKIRLKMEQDFQHTHFLLQSLCRLIPMTSMALLPLLQEMFPYINKGASVFENYTRNLLKITSYVPSLRKEILDIIVKNMLKLDVRISREAISNVYGEEDDDDDEALDEDEEDEDIFSMEIGSTSGVQEGGSKKMKKEEEEGEAVVVPPEDRLAILLPPAASLDAMMIIVLDYIRNSCYPRGEFDWTETKKIYRELLSTFDKYIFPTYLSNHTQFIMFYICSFKEALMDGFIDYLWKKVTDPMSQPIYRQIAACYIGSFLARASFVPISTAQTVMKLMMQWVHTYLDQTCDINSKPDIAHHAAFYSVCQSCFYIFCFRHTQFLQMKNGHRWAEALNLQRVATSKLNPLKFCLPIIVKTFTSATRTHQLAFCDTIVERNNRFSLPVSSSNSLENSTENRLHSFFPFDPYLLKKSGSIITPLYKEYQGFLPEDDDVETEDEDDFLPEDDAHLKPHDPFGMSVEKNPIDLLHYSVSPGFQNGEL